jgi:hypothetical protein
MKITSLEQAVRTLNVVEKSVIKFAPTVQSLLIFGQSHYLECGDAGFLTRIVRTLTAHKSVRGEKIKAYVIAHCGVKWEKLSDGSTGFKKCKDAAPLAMSEQWDAWKPEENKEEVSAFDKIVKICERLEKDANKKGLDKESSELFLGAHNALVAFLNATVDAEATTENIIKTLEETIEA